MHPDVQKLIEAKRITEQVGSRLDQLSPGKYCLHKSRGAGKIISWDLFRGEVTIDFERERAPKNMGLQLAISKTEPLDTEDFRAQRVEKLEEMRKLADEQPDQVVMRTLESHGGTMKADQIEKELRGTVVPEADYKKWWDRAKKLLREDGRVVVPARRTEPLVLRPADVRPVDALVEELLKLKDPSAKASVLDGLHYEIDPLKEDPELLQKILDEVHQQAKTGLKLNYSGVLDLLASRDELLDQIDGTTLPEDHLTLAQALKSAPADLGPIVSPLTSARQRRIYQAFPESYGQKAWEQLLAVFDRVGTRGVNEIAKLFIDNQQQKALFSHIRTSLSKRMLSAEALAWICRERTGTAKGVFSHEVGSALLSAIELDHLEDGPKRSAKLQNLIMNDKNLIADILDDVDINEVRNFARKLLQTPAFQELDRKSLMARVIKLYPSTQELVAGDAEPKKEQNLIVSWESLERRKAEYTELVNKRIPQNVKDIAIARSYGDLRENFEYKAAKQMQAVLGRRKAEMERELNLAQGTDFANPDTSSVNIGTVVELTGDQTQTTYTILGAWDSDPDQNIVSYLSDIGQSLIGHSVGDQVSVKDLETEQEITYTIKSITAWK